MPGLSIRARVIGRNGRGDVLLCDLPRSPPSSPEELSGSGYASSAQKNLAASGKKERQGERKKRRVEVAGRKGREKGKRKARGTKVEATLTDTWPGVGETQSAFHLPRHPPPTPSCSLAERRRAEKGHLAKSL